MRKFVTSAVGLVILAGASYGSVAYQIGSEISSAIGIYERRLLEIDGVSVMRLSYERRLFGGEIVYDIAWRPSREDPMRQLLEATLGPNAPPELRTAGQIPVRHGPWVGRFAAARAEIQATLPDAMRRFLPKYPGQAPWIQVNMVLDWSRTLTADLRFVDYSGRVEDPADASAIELTLDGLAGKITVADTTAAVAAEFTLPRLQIGHRTQQLQLRDIRMTSAGRRTSTDTVKGEFIVGALSAEDKGAHPLMIAAGPLSLEFDAERSWPYLWTGRSGFDLKRLTADAAGKRVSLSSLSVRSETKKSGERVTLSSSLDVGPSTFAGANLPALVLQLSAHDLEGRPLSDLLEAVELTTIHEPDSLLDLILARMPLLGEQLMTAGPKLSLDRFALSVRKADDLGVTFSAGVAPGTKIPFDQIDVLVEALEAHTTIVASLGAIEELLVLAERLDAIADDRLPFEARHDAKVRERFAQARTVIARQPLISIDGDTMRLDVRLSRGKLEVNGKPVDLFQALGTFGEIASGLVDVLSAPSPDPAQSATGPGRGESASTKPNALGTPSFGRLSLGPGFAPDPKSIALTAKGRTPLDDRLGPECIGFVDASRPDVVLDYAAGSRSLHIYAESNADTALIVQTPAGQWICNDDSPDSSLDPAVSIARPMPGRYTIWVATIERGEADATLFFSESNPLPRQR